tara:strand:+ start:417 stop:1328 length:912 start_codon:yes stop_codon:yes gene_type:complete
MNYVFFGIVSAHPLHHRNLAGQDYSKIFFEIPTVKDTDLYLLCKVKKLRVILWKTFILGNWLRISFKVGDKVSRGFWLNTSLTFGLSDLKIDRRRSSPTHLAFLDNNGQSLVIPPESFEQLLDLNLNNSPEILYVGESKDMKKRALKHEKISPAIAGLQDDEELRLHFLKIKYEYNFSNGNILNCVSLNMHKHLYIPGYDFEMVERLKVQVAERFLINYYRPLLNKTHKGDNISKNKIIVDFQKKLNIQRVLMGTEMHGTSFQFWSPYQRLKSKDFVFNFGENPGYQTLDLPSWIGNHLSNFK